MDRSRSRLHRSAVPTWSLADAGFVDEPVTSWREPTADLVPGSDRIRLAGATLESESMSPHPRPVLTRNDAGVRYTVLLVARLREVRRYLRSCLDNQSRLRVADVASVTAAVSLTREVAVHLIIADSAAWSVSRALPEIRTILLSDGPPSHEVGANGKRRHVMHRPFSAETLAATVNLLLHEPD